MPGGRPLGPGHVIFHPPVKLVTSNSIEVIGDRLHTLFGFALLPAATAMVAWPRTLIVPLYDTDAQAPPLVLIV